MRNPPAAFKHADPTHLKFGQSGDSSLLAKRRGYEDGGEVKGGDDWYKQGWKYWDDKYKEVGPKPQAFDAEKQEAITQGLSGASKD